MNVSPLCGYSERISALEVGAPMSEIEQGK